VSGHGGGRRRKHHEEHDEHPSEAWLIALADMMTLLMVTFLMMFAISNLDLKKFQTFKEAFAKGTGTSLPSLPGTGVPQVGDAYTEPVAIKDGDPTPVASAWTANTGGTVMDAKELEKIKDALNKKFDEAGLGDKVEAKIDKRGVVIYVTSALLFASGEAEVTAQGTALLDKVAPILKKAGNDLVVEGHTDSRPITSAVYPSNWELSAARATAVVRQLIDKDGIARKRLSMAGYADTRPRQDLPTEHAFALNRRVEIIVVARPIVFATKVTPSGAPGRSASPEPSAVPSPEPAEASSKDDSGH
jgi:chemotaxis protein MotB